MDNKENNNLITVLLKFLKSISGIKNLPNTKKDIQIHSQNLEKKLTEIETTVQKKPALTLKEETLLAESETAFNELRAKIQTIKNQKHQKKIVKVRKVTSNKDFYKTEKKDSNLNEKEKILRNSNTKKIKRIKARVKNKNTTENINTMSTTTSVKTTHNTKKDNGLTNSDKSINNKLNTIQHSLQTTDSDKTISNNKIIDSINTNSTSTNTIIMPSSNSTTMSNNDKSKYFTPDKKAIIHVNDSCTITLTKLKTVSTVNPEMEYDNEYDEILSNDSACHIYQVEKEEKEYNGKFEYTNYVYGNINLEKLQACNTLSYANNNTQTIIDCLQYKNAVVQELTGKNFEDCLLNSYGNIGCFEKDSNGTYVHKNIKNAVEIESRFRKTLDNMYTCVNLKEFDNRDLVVTKIGLINVSNSNKIIDALEQYIVTTHNNYENVQEYLVYGHIDFSKLYALEEQKNNTPLINSTYAEAIVNILLSNKNMEKKYIGKIIQSNDELYNSYILTHNSVSRRKLMKNKELTNDYNIDIR